MAPLKMKLTIDTLINSLLIVVSILVIGVTAPRLMAEWQRLDRVAQQTYNSGDRADWLSPVDFSVAQRGTVVLFINSSCRYCTDSMGFYKRVLELSTRGDIAVRVVAASFEPVERTAAYLKGYDINVHQIVSLTTQQTRLRSTPTLLLIDREGKIEKTWVGLQSPDGEAEIIAVLRRSA
jgi:hypothetical protein